MPIGQIVVLPIAGDALSHDGCRDELNAALAEARTVA
jgi:hypothetical protein